MQIYLTENNQYFEVSEYVTARFSDGRLTINHCGKESSCPAEIGESYIIKRTDKGLIVKAELIPKSYAGKVGYCLSFAEEKICISLDEFNIRSETVKEVYPSKKFISVTNHKTYAFLVAKKKDRRIYAPLLLWVSDKITSEELEELIHKFRKYRKIYHPEAFTKIHMEPPKTN